MACAVAPDQRHRDTRNAHLVSTAGGQKDITQLAVSARVACGEPPTREAQEVGGGQDGVAGRIGMDDAANRIDQEHAGRDTVERIGEGCSFRGLEIDRLADQNGAPDMRNDESHAPARIVVDEAVALVTKDAEHCDAGRGLLQHGCDEVHQARRLRPFAIESGLEEFVVRNQIGGGDRPFDLGRKCPAVDGSNLIYLSK